VSLSVSLCLVLLSSVGIVLMDREGEGCDVETGADPAVVSGRLILGEGLSHELLQIHIGSAAQLLQLQVFGKRQ